VIVDNTVGADALAIGTDNGNTGIETKAIVPRVRLGLEAIVLLAVLDDKGGDIPIVGVQHGWYSHRVLTDGTRPGADCGPKGDFIAGLGGALRLQRQRFCGLCDNVALFAIEKGDVGTPTV